MNSLVFSVIFARLPSRVRKTRSIVPPSDRARTWREPDRKCIYAFISPGSPLRLPIECKIMAACRIFAGATVTNISDKSPSLPHHLPCPARTRVPFRISLYWFTANWYSLSHTLSLFLSSCRYHIFDAASARTLGDINLKILWPRLERELYYTVLLRVIVLAN